MLFPPVDILFVTKRTNHDCPGSEFWINCIILDNRDSVTKERNSKALPLKVVIPVIFRIDSDRNTCCKELGPGCCNFNAVKIEIVQLSLSILIGDFSKCNRCFTTGAVVDRMFILVYITGFQHPQKRELGF